MPILCLELIAVRRYFVLCDPNMSPLDDLFVKKSLISDIIDGMDYATSSIGDHIKSLRKARGLTQRELALQSGLSFSFINQLERGKQSVRLDALMRLAEVFGYEVSLVKAPRPTKVRDLE